MRVLSDKSYSLLKSILKLNEDSLKKGLRKYLDKYYSENKILETKEYLIALGDIPIALIAHLDTVHMEKPVDIFYDRYENVIWSPEGLGADDRAGVYSIIQIISSGLRPTVIFTTGEEIGGIGASKLVKDYLEMPVDLKYIIELDRRGEQQCVFYNCGNKDFVKYIESFGFEASHGTFTDISIICPKWEIAGVNLSVGYENEHSHIEILYVDYMLDTIDKVKAMLIKAEKAPKFEYIPLPDNKEIFKILYSLEEIKSFWDPEYEIPMEEWLKLFGYDSDSDFDF